MNLQIMLTDNIYERVHQNTCFSYGLDKNIAKSIASCKPVQGIAIVNGEMWKFYFSPNSMDGSLFPIGEDNYEDYRGFLLKMIPLYVYTNLYVNKQDDEIVGECEAIEP